MTSATPNSNVGGIIDLDHSHFDVVDGGHVHHANSGHEDVMKYKDVYAALIPQLEPTQHNDKPFTIIANERYEHKLLHQREKAIKMGAEEHLVQKKAE